MAALQYLESLCNMHPELSEWYTLLADLYQKKLWDKFHEKLHVFASCAVFKEGDASIQLYHNVFTNLETRIHPLKLAHDAVGVSRQCSENEAAIGFLEGAIKRLEDTKMQRIDEAIVFIKIEIASLKLLQGDQEECIKLLEDGEVTLGSLTDINPSVFASYHLVSSKYYDSCEEYSEFYKSALLHLKYVWSFDPPDSLKQEWAFKLGIAALVGDNIYNFGELFAHPIMKSLSGTDREWLYYILQAFNCGDLSEYKKLCEMYENAIQAEPVLVEKEERLREKTNIRCLMEIIYRQPPGARTIRLTLIAERTELSVEDVELLLIKTLSVRLIVGTIDHVEGKVHVYWLQPKVLEIHELKSLKERIESWEGKVSAALKSIYNESPYLKSVFWSL